jgi:hypothetical protein
MVHPTGAIDCTIVAVAIALVLFTGLAPRAGGALADLPGRRRARTWQPVAAAAEATCVGANHATSS